jgi:hypothetical protein
MAGLFFITLSMAFPPANLKIMRDELDLLRGIAPLSEPHAE